jgi:hypothetical protein
LRLDGGQVEHAADTQIMRPRIGIASVRSRWEKADDGTDEKARQDNEIGPHMRSSWNLIFMFHYAFLVMLCSGVV